MNTAIASALSGLKTAQLRLDISAHNVANASTAGFAPLAVRARALPQGGVEPTVQRLPAPGVDWTAQWVEQKMAANAFGANWRVFQTTDRMLGQLLDAVG
ncbi:flagellar basal body protein [Tepidimonas charontis]|uniref:Flagellar hook-associated protein FlgK n=1 Tax=Tepidimonas charontis TaxID=2267262 RepID=A0A554XHL5_9BURK|nr:flagellar basal body protein [Tepidimonas charontis]TSE35288.1 flagellar hook-associated protein FlgK [Tepidimonas charontis]